ncbi:MAG: PP2C family protein-serine/threonine phosphatase [Ruminococcus sp.]|nr:PP2C family protein-serine/threonine phosphatase [Ruminococcus sp.]
MERKKKTRHGKLIAQVGLITSAIFILTINFVAYTMYKSSVDGFLGGQQTSIEDRLNNIEFRISFHTNLEQMVDFWMNNPSISSQSTEPIRPEEFVADVCYGSPDPYETNWQNNSSDYVKSYLSKIGYSSVKSELDMVSQDYDYDSVMLLRNIDDKTGYVISEYKKNLEPMQLGDILEYDLEDHPALKEVINSAPGTSQVHFERVENFTASGTQYIGYKPYYYEDKLVAIIAISYNWSAFEREIRSSIFIRMVIGVCALLLESLIISLLLYRKAIVPVTKIQHSVRGYIETMDSAQVIEDMSKVKQKNEFGELSEDISRMVNEIDRYTSDNIKLAKEQERVLAELELAAKLQNDSLPKDFPENDKFSLFASMTPAKEVGGDFYDFFFIDNDHIGLVMADVSDKGVPAAMFMMMSKSLIFNFAMRGYSPKKVFENVNEQLLLHNDEGMFVTVWFGILELSSGKIVAANAGHEYPVIKKADGRFEMFKEKHGFMLGCMPGVKYTEYEFTLDKGGALFVYTDGVTEATANDEEIFDNARLISALNTEPDAEPEQILKNVSAAVDDFIGDVPQFDDLTMMAVKMKDDERKV